MRFWLSLSDHPSGLPIDVRVWDTKPRRMRNPPNSYRTYWHCPKKRPVAEISTSECEEMFPCCVPQPGKCRCVDIIANNVEEE